MARPLRIEYPGAWYHVMNRGAGRKPIFKTAAQRSYFLALLADVHERFHAEIHAYCLMGNHYHLLVRTPEGNLQRIMRHINGVYTQYFNRTEKRDGALFRGRYKAILVDAEAYWLELSRYIHRNPLEAHITRRLDDYRWSSYPAYVEEVKPPAWLETGYVLGALGQRNQKARYKAFVSGDTNAALKAFYDRSKVGPILGDEPFKQRALREAVEHPDVPAVRAARQRPTATDIVQTVARYYGVKPKTLYQSARGRGVKTPARSLAMYLCQARADMTLARIAEHFGLSRYDSAGATIRNVRHQLRDKTGLQRDLNRMLQDLTP